MLKELLYRGPSIEALHRDYAKQGRIDDQAPVTTTYEVHVNAPLQRVWTLLSTPEGWHAFDPAIHDVHLDAPVIADTPFTWVNGRTRIRSRFAIVDPDRELTWTGVASGAKVVHRHLLAATDDGGTRVRCEESMAGPGLVLFYGSAKLQAGLRKWLTALKAGAEERR